jgi:hypothetical protein
MAELSRDEVISVLGPKLSDVVVAEIIGTGITKDELLQARARVIKDTATHNPGPAMTPGHIASVVDILERLKQRGVLGEAGSKLE